MWTKIFIFISCFILASCKEVIDAPLGNISRSLPVVIEGDWSAVENDDLVEITINQISKGTYKIEIYQNDGSFSGEMIVGAIKDGLIFNIKSSSISYQGKTVYQDKGSHYRLVGAYVIDEKLTVIPADMDSFIKIFSRDVKKSDNVLINTCHRNEQACNDLFKPSSILEVRSIKSLNKQLSENFDAIFPAEDGVTFHKAK